MALARLNISDNGVQAAPALTTQRQTLYRRFILDHGRHSQWTDLNLRNPFSKLQEISKEGVLYSFYLYFHILFNPCTCQL